VLAPGPYQAWARAIFLGGILFTYGLFMLSRRTRELGVRAEGLRFIFVVPALNEAKVIRATVEHLLSFPDASVVVIDDASVDDTAAEVQRVASPRVFLLRRRLPDARRGKGLALNAAYSWLFQSGLLDGTPASRVILCVLDADGRLTPGALHDAAECFADPVVGGCQVSIRIRNRDVNLWTRMQHMELVTWTVLFQRARDRTHAVHLGGNGQFVRLSALMTLDGAPWTPCLTEDLEIGIRLTLEGWRNRYIPTSWVSQQAIPDLRRLLRQRTRWFQGVLQCSRYLPRVLSSDRLPLPSKMDLTLVLLWPIVGLIAFPVVVLAWAHLLVFDVPAASGAHGVLALALFYALAFALALVIGFVFWLEQNDKTLPGSLLAGHVFLLYGYLWYVVGWRAAIRELLHRREWAKTNRVDEVAAP